ncbi:MAG: hypothetical protein U0520_03200 [Candidatus Saccharimonadales bacterium]
MSKSDPKTVWEAGKDKYYEHYRLSKSATSAELRKWVDEAYYKNGLCQYLDKNFTHELRDNDFYARLWELEVAEWLEKTGIKMLPTNGKGFDFCLELPDGKKIWIEAVLATEDDELKEIQRQALQSGAVFNTPREQFALRYSSVLFTKATKIKEKYLQDVGKDDFTLIAVSGYPMSMMGSSMDLFMLGILPIDFQVVHISTDGKPLDPNVPRPTHTMKQSYQKKTGASVKKEFLYPGTHFPFIDGVMFSEASNLQQLLGTGSASFNEETNCPHIFENYVGKSLPEDFTKFFYCHSFKDSGNMASLEMKEPTVK